MTTILDVTVDATPQYICDIVHQYYALLWNESNKTFFSITGGGLAHNTAPLRNDFVSGYRTEFIAHSLAPEHAEKVVQEETSIGSIFSHKESSCLIPLSPSVSIGYVDAIWQNNNKARVQVECLVEVKEIKQFFECLADYISEKTGTSLPAKTETRTKPTQTTSAANDATLSEPTAKRVATNKRTGKIGGRPRNTDDEWARQQVHKLGRSKREVFPEWKKRIGERANNLADLKDSFDKVIGKKPKKQE